jgi:hypothetical protein
MMRLSSASMKYKEFGILYYEDNNEWGIYRIPTVGYFKSSKDAKNKIDELDIVEFRREYYIADADKAKLIHDNKYGCARAARCEGYSRKENKVFLEGFGLYDLSNKCFVENYHASKDGKFKIIKEATIGQMVEWEKTHFNTDECWDDYKLEFYKWEHKTETIIIRKVKCHICGKIFDQDKDIYENQFDED